MKLLLCVLMGCAASPPPLAPSHPANAAAPAGRIAPAPPSLRAGLALYPEVSRDKPKPAQHHHHAP